MSKPNTKISVTENLHWNAFPDIAPGTDEMMLVICKTKAGVYSWNRAWFDGHYWHGSGSMSNVIAGAPILLLVEDICDGE